MSAFIVGKRHIDALVTVALKGPKDGTSNWRESARWFIPNPSNGSGTWNQATIDNAKDVGQMLWQENVNSVAYRYDSHDHLPGPVDYSVEAYEYQRIKEGLTIVESFKAINGYEYQACEHPQWEASEAKAFCTYLKESLIYAMPGYDAAPWAWD